MNETSDRPTISVTADAIVARKPDVTYVSLYFRGEGILLEDAVREAAGKTEDVLRVLRDTCGADLKEVQVKDIHAGETKPAIGMIGRDKSNSSRPELVQGILVVLAPKPDLAVKIVDLACRMGCLMSNQGGGLVAGPGMQNVILYGLADPVELEQEATALAIADARKKALEIATRLGKRLGALRTINAMAIHTPEDFMRRNRTPLLSRGTYLSVSPEQVEVPAKVSMSFELLD